MHRRRRRYRLVFTCTRGLPWPAIANRLLTVYKRQYAYVRTTHKYNRRTYVVIIYLKSFYLGFEKSQRSVTHDSLRCINILTYLLNY